MKLAKQIILLSAVLVLAMGLAFTLVGGIVIGQHAGMSDEMRLINTWEAMEIRELRREFNEELGWWDDKIKQHQNARIAATEPEDMKEYEVWFEKETERDEAIADLRYERDNWLNGDKWIVDETGNIGARAQLREDIREIREIANLARVGVKAGFFIFPGEPGEPEEVVTARDRLISAFYTQRVIVDNDNDITTYEPTQLSAMGALLVAGVAFVFIGAGLVVTIIFMNKCAGKKEAKKAA